MTKRRRGLFWAETVSAGLCALAGFVALLWPTWIEGTFGVDPDHGSGIAEWTVIAAFFAVSIVCATLAMAQQAHRRRVPVRPT